jgi:hypothetical protein
LLSATGGGSREDLMHQSLRKASISLIMIGCWSFNAYADDTIQHAVKEFASAIQNPKELHDLIGDDGLIVIRNFVTGGWGTRGRDIRYSLQKRDVPLDGSFPVKGETPVVLSLLFAESRKKGLDSEFSTVQAKSNLCFFSKRSKKCSQFPTTNDAINSIAEAISDIKLGTISIVQLSSDEFLYTEAADVIGGLPVGNFAVFSMRQGRYRLVALLDLR